MTDISDFAIHDYPRIVGRLPVAPHLRPKPPRETRPNCCEKIVMIPREWGIEKRFVVEWVELHEVAGWYVDGEA
jgi:hypothetical protein